VTALTDAAKAIAESTPELSAGLAALRVPFPPSQIGLLPKPYRKDSPKGECGVCGKFHGLPAMHLDFVGHGAITQRLLDVDPHWNWEPFAVDASGLPAVDRHGDLWIRLTVCGVTRIGVGEGGSSKVLIGNAIRNAAMRFGVALDLWARGQEDEHDPEPEPVVVPPLVLAKRLVLELAKGDKELAAAAWEFMSGDSMEGYDEAAITAAFEAFMAPEAEG
jgi:hypothetical protein